MAVPPERDVATCANCGAELVADQRYCLSCGQAVSPVRLAFLDVLGEDARGNAPATPGTIEVAPIAYVPADQHGLGGWLRRNGGLLGLLAVLLLCLIAGLLVGHWVTQNNKTPVAGPSTVKIEGLGASAVAPASTTTPAAATHAKSKASSAASRVKREEQEEEKEAAEEAKAAKPPPAPVKVSPSKLQKLSSSHGKKHAEEINALGDTPIETGG